MKHVTRCRAVPTWPLCKPHLPTSPTIRPHAPSQCWRAEGVGTIMGDIPLWPGGAVITHLQRSVSGQRRLHVWGAKCKYVGIEWMKVVLTKSVLLCFSSYFNLDMSDYINIRNTRSMNTLHFGLSTASEVFFKILLANYIHVYANMLQQCSYLDKR